MTNYIQRRRNQELLQQERLVGNVEKQEDIYVHAFVMKTYNWVSDVTALFVLTLSTR